MNKSSINQERIPQTQCKRCGKNKVVMDGARHPAASTNPFKHMENTKDREMFKSLASELNHLLQRRRPFLPEKIYEKSSVLRARLVTNAISISNPSSESQAVRDYFEQLEKIIPLADELLDEVRACVASWQETSKYISPSSPSEGF